MAPLTCTLRAVILALATIPAMCLSAQSLSKPDSGAIVRLTGHTEFTDADTVKCIGRLRTAWGRDSVAVRCERGGGRDSVDMWLRPAALTRVDVMRGGHPRKTEGAVIGALVGSAVFGVQGYRTASPAQPATSGCGGGLFCFNTAAKEADDPWQRAALGAIAGAILGALLGSEVGGWFHGSDWETVAVGATGTGRQGRFDIALHPSVAGAISIGGQWRVGF